MPADLTLRPVTPEEFPTFATVHEAAFGVRVTPADVPRDQAVFEFDRSCAAFAGGRLVGTSGVFSTRQRIPGGELDVGVVSWVGVARDHRRRGVLTGMMRSLLEQARDRGEALSSLFASEAAIYGRFGFGAATHEAFLRVERHATRLRDGLPSGGTVRSVPLADAAALLAPVYERMRAHHTGVPSRTPGWWAHQVLADSPEPSPGVGPREVAVHERDGVPDGYVLSQLRDARPQGFSDRTLEVSELVALSPEAHTDLWRYCLDADLTDRLLAFRRPRTDPLPLAVTDPRRVRGELYDGLYLRFVDLPAALSARAWTGSDRLRLAVLDPFWPPVAGTWELAVTQGRATCVRCDADPDLVLDAPALAATYLRDTRPEALRAAGRLRERTGGACARLDRLLGITPPAWAPQEF